MQIPEFYVRTPVPQPVPQKGGILSAENVVPERSLGQQLTVNESSVLCGMRSLEHMKKDILGMINEKFPMSRALFNPALREMYRKHTDLLKQAESLGLGWGKEIKSLFKECRKELLFALAECNDTSRIGFMEYSTVFCDNKESPNLVCKVPIKSDDGVLKYKMNRPRKMEFTHIAKYLHNSLLREQVYYPRRMIEKQCCDGVNTVVSEVVKLMLKHKLVSKKIINLHWISLRRLMLEAVNIVIDDLEAEMNAALRLKKFSVFLAQTPGLKWFFPFIRNADFNEPLEWSIVRKLQYQIDKLINKQYGVAHHSTRHFLYKTISIVLNTLQKVLHSAVRDEFTESVSDQFDKQGQPLSKCEQDKRALAREQHLRRTALVLARLWMDGKFDNVVRGLAVSIRDYVVSRQAAKSE